ncbi:hypothetical protein KUV23_18325 [Algoriphagus marincola]|uniref:YARHG domain-containing protein n=1 Tax=Algoriphagus marincola TaxID=264027 RepID=A0ABS7N9E5_9BACT|nr:hypothetical protein [Algoriphagus marincola]MBY5952939.1 hypothetical protein [Algoriphagus marincola]
MKWLLINSLFLTLLSSSLQNCQSNLTIDDRLNYMKNVNYDEDKKQIANCFMANIEYYRKFHGYGLNVYTDSPDSLKRKYSTHYAKYPGAEKDPANFFEPYASRYNSLNETYVNSPFQTKNQLTITTDTIIYNKNGLFCVAFLVIHLNYDEIEGLESKRDSGREFDAKAIIGYRESIEAPFDIFPLTKHQVIGFESYDAAILMLKDLYFNHLKGKGSTGTVYEGEKFRHNVGDKNFFNFAPYFQKHKSGNYNFQMYRYRNEDLLFKYLKCDD